MLSFYFIELTPSLIIIVVLWKSNNELRYKRALSPKPNTSLVDRSNNGSKFEVDSLTKPLDENSLTDGMDSGITTSYDQSYNDSGRKTKKSTKKSSHKSSTKVKDNSPLVNPKAAMTYY